MNPSQRRRLKMMRMFCERAIELIDEDIDLFIAERPTLVQRVQGGNPWYKKPRNIRQKKKMNKEAMKALSKEMVEFFI